MLKRILKRCAPARTLHATTRAATAHLRGLWRHTMRRQLLTAGLVAVYFVLITPIALIRRIFGVSIYNTNDTGRGWRAIRQSSADNRIYLGDF